MKKLLVVCLLFVLSVPVFASKGSPGGFIIAAGLDVAEDRTVNTGLGYTLSRPADKKGISAFVHYLFPVSDSFAIGPGASLAFKRQNLGYEALYASIRYYFSNRFFLLSGLGMSVINITGANSETGAYFGFGVGYEIVGGLFGQFLVSAAGGGDITVASINLGVGWKF